MKVKMEILLLNISMPILDLRNQLFGAYEKNIIPIKVFNL